MSKRVFLEMSIVMLASKGVYNDESFVFEVYFSERKVLGKGRNENLPFFVNGSL